MEAVAASDRVCTRRSLGGVGSVATAAGAACLNRNPSRRPVALRERTTRPGGRIAQRYDMTSLEVNRIPTRQQPLREEKTVVSGAQAGAGHGGNDGWGLWQTTARSEGRGGRL